MAFISDTSKRDPNAIYSLSSYSVTRSDRTVSGDTIMLKSLTNLHQENTLSSSFSSHAYFSDSRIDFTAEKDKHNSPHFPIKEESNVNANHYHSHNNNNEGSSD